MSTTGGEIRQRSAAVTFVRRQRLLAKSASLGLRSIGF